MSGAWLVYSLFVATAVAVGARAAESLGRRLGYPVRWIWAGGMLVTLALADMAPYRGTTAAPPAVSALAAPSPAAATAESWLTRLPRLAATGLRRIKGPAAAALYREPEAANGVLKIVTRGHGTP
jgi:hypothetical protein